MQSRVSRRDTLKAIASAGAGAMALPLGACLRGPAKGAQNQTAKVKRSMPTEDPAAAILSITPLGFQWETLDPFLFCVHHNDQYPEGNGKFGPAASLAGRNLGSDFEPRDGWRMYHGETVPGFPQHPHRGFETVTVVRRGLLDHSDSLGAAARYGRGDVQWLTAGSGIQHAEMFPLIERNAKNPVELFQIWLNLPSANKMVDAYFSMLWNDKIPRRVVRDGLGNPTELTLIAGRYDETRAPAPPPKSWASESDSDLAIWTLRMGPGARFVLPAARTGSNRALYFFRGSGLRAAGVALPDYHRARLRPDVDVALESGTSEAELLLLQGRPIGEPVVQYGPFVMNTPDEIRQAFADYQRTQFGGWPWKITDPVHGADGARFARFIDGHTERPA
jgi:redox-sensitive bicupin YhaK (pirin superfamily)